MRRTLLLQALLAAASTLVVVTCLLLAAILIPAIGKMGESLQASAQSSTQPRTIDRNFRQRDAAAWRRTTHGWERRSEWEAMQPRRRVTPPLAAVHPLLPAALILLLSLAALVAFSPSCERNGASRRCLVRVTRG